MNTVCYEASNGIRGENGGQVAKEFAFVHGFDTTQLSTGKYKTGARSSKNTFFRYQYFDSNTSNPKGSNGSVR